MPITGINSECLDSTAKRGGVRDILLYLFGKYPRVLWKDMIFRLTLLIPGQAEKQFQPVPASLLLDVSKKAREVTLAVKAGPAVQLDAHLAKEQ